jgi:molybdopterin-guanine dinucleotide biosynthesis protein A
MNDISCIILAGGESKRFGENKVFYDFNGKTFLERALDTAYEISEDIVISVRYENQIKFFIHEVKKIFKKKADFQKKSSYLRIIADKSCGFKGPLKGIYSSIGDLKGSTALIMECDAPFFNAAAAIELIKKIEIEKSDAVIPFWADSTVEPLLACYKIKKTSCLLETLNSYAINLKENFLFTDSVNIARFLPTVYYYGIFDIVKNNPGVKSKSFLNINSKEDFEKHSERMKKNSQNIAKSVKINKINKYFDLKNPINKPYGILAKALYYWWIYVKTGQFIYLKQSFECFKKDRMVYSKNKLNFMGDKILNLLRNSGTYLNLNLLFHNRKDI